MGDYIIREAAMEIVKRTSGDYAAAFSEIRKLPAADAEPVRHGRWLERKEHIYLADGVCKEWINFYCSECDAPSKSPTYFCPNCGAKMDLENEGEV